MKKLCRGKTTSSQSSSTVKTRAATDNEPIALRVSSRLVALAGRAHRQAREL